MKPEDYQEFKILINRDCERRAKPLYSAGLLQEMFEDLEDVTLAQFIYAAKCHRRSSAGVYSLSVANVRKQLGLKNVQDLEWIDVISMAKSKNTPLAIVASRYILSCDLQKPDIENRGAAEHFLSEMPGHLFRLENGGFSEHELVLCGKYGVNPRSNIHTGHSVLPDECKLNYMIESTKQTNQWKLMIEERRESKQEALAIENNLEGQLKIAKEICRIGEIIPAHKEPVVDNTAELKAAFNSMMDKEF